MRFLKWKIATVFAAVCSLGTIVASVSCSSTAPQNLTSQYAIALRTFTQNAEATGDYRGLKFDAYYWNLKKGEFVKLLMRKMRFDENGIWTADFDPFVEILTMLNPEISWSFTLEEENSLLSTLQSYLYAPMDRFLRNNFRGSASWKQSVSLDEKSQKPVWELEIDFPYDMTQKNGSKMVNELLSEWTISPAYTNGYLATEFGLLSVPVSIRPFKKANCKSLSETAIGLIEPVMDLDMYGYILVRPALSVAIGVKGTYELQWYLQRYSYLTFPIQKYYSDENKIYDFVSYKITFVPIWEEAQQQEVC